MTLAAQAATAHPLAPALLQLNETAPARYAVLWRTPVARLQGRDVTPRLPADCAALGEPVARIEDGEALVSRWTVQCAAGGLAGKPIGVEGIETSGINVVVQVRSSDSAEFKGLLGADQPTFTVNAENGSAFARYLALGSEHLLTGADHLLFLLGLFLLVGAGHRVGPGHARDTMRSLIVTVTAFTVGHSLTLALAVLDVVHVRQAYAEIAIALTVLVLALEIVREPSRPWAAPTVIGGPSRPRAAPTIMAGAFGLVHGLGFAGALRDVGLPRDDIPQALLAFNLGIEAAQLALIAALVAAVAVARRLPLAWRAPPTLARAVPAYVTGSLAVCWCLERSAVLLG